MRMNVDLRDMSSAQFREVLDGMDRSLKQVAADHIAELREPISFEGCDPDITVHLMSIQHDVGQNSILISWDGNPANVRRVPLMSKRDRPITSLYHSQIEWTPERLGFQIYMIPGWLASERKFAQARSPQLSDAVEWTDEQRAAWNEMRKRWEWTRPKVRDRRPIMTRNDAA
jgi:hypothetical protein